VLVVTAGGVAAQIPAVRYSLFGKAKPNGAVDSKPKPGRHGLTHAPVGEKPH